MAVLFGSTAFDSFKDSTRWVKFIQGDFVADHSWAPKLFTNLGLLGFVLLVALVFTLGTMLTGVGPERSRRDLPGQFAHSIVPIVIDVVRRGLRWRGDLGPSLIAQLSGHHGIHDLRVVGDPVAWALGVLCLVDREDPARRLRPSRRDVQQAFREGLRDAHPDHGGDDEAAAERIARLSEARRILLTSASVA